MADDLNKEREGELWSGRIGDQKARLRKELDSSGKSARDFICELLDLRDVQQKTVEHSLDNLPEMNGINEHLSIVSKLVRSILVTAKDEVVRNETRADESHKLLNEHIVKSHQEREEARLAIEEAEKQKKAVEKQNDELTAKVLELEEKNHTLLKSLMRIEEAWDEATYKLEAAERMEDALKMKNQQLSAALEEKAAIAKKLRDKEDELSKTVSGYGEKLTQLTENHKTELARITHQHQQELITVNEWASINLQKALVEQQAKDLGTIQELRDKITELKMSTH